jgi:Flp pilus assembly pilin Flp
MLRMIARLLRNESGVSPVEYALIAAIVTVATTFAVSAAGFSIADILG